MGRQRRVSTEEHIVRRMIDSCDDRVAAALMVYENVPALRDCVVGVLSTQEKEIASVRAVLIAHGKRITRKHTKLAEAYIADGTNLENVIENVPKLRDRAAALLLEKNGESIPALMTVIRWCPNLRKEAAGKYLLQSASYAEDLELLMWIHDSRQCVEIAVRLVTVGYEKTASDNDETRALGTFILQWVELWKRLNTFIVNAFIERITQIKEGYKKLASVVEACDKMPPIMELLRYYFGL